MIDYEWWRRLQPIRDVEVTDEKSARKAMRVAEVLVESLRRDNAPPEVFQWLHEYTEPYQLILLQ